MVSCFRESFHSHVSCIGFVVLIFSGLSRKGHKMYASHDSYLYKVIVRGIRAVYALLPTPGCIVLFFAFSAAALLSILRLCEQF